jgi:hypothetical protein
VRPEELSNTFREAAVSALTARLQASLASVAAGISQEVESDVVLQQQLHTRGAMLQQDVSAQCQAQSMQGGGHVYPDT